MMHDPHSDFVDLTSGLSRSVKANERNALGTSKPEFIRPSSLLRINTKQVVSLEDDEDPLPSSNRADSIESSRAELLSARSNQSSIGTTSSSDVSLIHANRFGIMVMPDDDLRFGEICKRKIGNGSKMCIKKNCTTHHRGDLASVIRGDIFVQKSTESVFLEPRVHDICITNKVLHQWLDGPRRRIDEWVLAYALASSTDHDEVLTRDGYNQGTLFTAHAKSHKSPEVSMARRFEKLSDTYTNVFDFAGTDPLGDPNGSGNKKRTYGVEDLVEMISLRPSKYWIL